MQTFHLHIQTKSEVRGKATPWRISALQADCDDLVLREKRSPTLKLVFDTVRSVGVPASRRVNCNDRLLQLDLHLGRNFPTDQIGAGLQKCIDVGPVDFAERVFQLFNRRQRD